MLCTHTGALLWHHACLGIHELSEEIRIFVINDLRIRSAKVALLGLHCFHIRTVCRLG